MRITFITSNYPTSSRPVSGTFVQQFVWAMARYGHKCTVINPSSIFERKYGTLPPKFDTEDAGGGESVSIYHPRFVSFSSKDMGWTHTGRWTQSAMNRVVIRDINKLPFRPDLIYGHFLYSAGFCAMKLGEELNCTSVIGVGESSTWTLDTFGVATAQRHFANHGYFLANSMPNKEMLVNLLGISIERILVEPNGIDLSRMYLRDRVEMKSKHAISDGFLVAFVGANEVRKGPNRVINAIEGFTDVRCLLMGNGTEVFKSSCIVRSGPISHALVPELLNCADIFVLPTTGEGSCNAVIEAMACGLPIVTSNGRYMDDIVDDEVAIRVDPTDVGAIREAILKLKNDPELRQRMSDACLRKAKKFDINERAKRVTEWMEKLLRQNNAFEKS